MGDKKTEIGENTSNDVTNRITFQNITAHAAQYQKK